MRAAVLLVCLAGCLAAPAPSPADLDDAGAGTTPDALVPSCLPGSQLDLVHVSQISFIAGVSATLSLPGLAVFVNPGLDTVIIPDVSASVVGADPRVNASVSLGGAEAGLILSPGDAKGALSESAAAVVRPAFQESWVDAAQPDLVAGFALLDDEFEDALPIDVSLQVHAGEYEFALTISLVADDGKMAGTPVAATRTTASCE